MRPAIFKKSLSGLEIHEFAFKEIAFEDLTERIILKNTVPGFAADTRALQQISPVQIEVDHGVFTHQQEPLSFPEVRVNQHEHQLLITCTCGYEGSKLCIHQALVLNAIIKRDDLAVFFNSKRRHETLVKFAVDYGLELEPDLDRYFKLGYEHKKLTIATRSASLIPVTRDSLNALSDWIVKDESLNQKQLPLFEDMIVVLKQHKFYKYLFIELYSATKTKEGKIKNPLTPVAPLDFAWQTEHLHELKFFTGIHKFQHHLNAKRTEADLIALRAIVKNPLGLAFYAHDSGVSENITSTSVLPVKVKLLPDTLTLPVSRKAPFYEISGNIIINETTYKVSELSIRFNYFVQIEGVLYLAGNLQSLEVIDLLKRRNGDLQVHELKYPAFKTQFLHQLEEKINVNYTYMPPATAEQMEEQGFNTTAERIIYLSDFGSHVMIIPVMRYGEVEIPIRTKKPIYGEDNQGKPFLVKREHDAEDIFIALLTRQHPYFDEQRDDALYYFYLHKKHFLEENWFLNVFEEWQSQGITIHGFNEIEGNKLSPYKVKINIKVISGLNWFNAQVNVKYGKKQATLNAVFKALQSKSKYVRLDDGTMGILPADWIEKFTGYFNAGEIDNENTLRIPKVNFTSIEQLFEDAMLEEPVKNELAIYREKLGHFDNIKEVPVPQGLTGELRHYQQTGLNWLNFLDDFNFGGCLADDMGLGKTLQIIAFILTQRTKVSRNTNLLVVPTSLIFNWQHEFEKFAPSIKILTIYGADRLKSSKTFDDYEVILTSYGTLLNDIVFLKEYVFNYVFLDESQNIKNPESQRYKAAKLLKSRNKIVITGTPVENNTYDLYGQMSFACPGLLGSKQYFKDIYSQPIDKFKSTRHAVELQKKISPFILRRTKQQVAAELPEKTEMVLFCEMGQKQREIYNAYEKQFREYISATSGDELDKSPMNVLKGLTTLRQICDSPLLIEGKMPQNASAKIDMLLEQIESKSPRHKILVFSQFVSMLELIRNELVTRDIGFAWLSGSTRNRNVVVNDFQTNDATRVFLISLKAGGTGLNLTEADYVYLVDPWWNPAVENQAIDRSHRIGQDKKVVAVRLICPDTVEEKILHLQEHKRALAGDLIKTDGSFLKSLKKEDLLNLLKEPHSK